MTAQPVNRQEVEEAEKYDKITTCLAERTAEILHFNEAVSVQSMTSAETFPNPIHHR
jgi:hypothetical protein